MCEGWMSRLLRTYGDGVSTARVVQKLGAGRSEPETEGWAQGDPQMSHPKGREKAEMDWYGAQGCSSQK